VSITAVDLPVPELPPVVATSAFWKLSAAFVKLSTSKLEG